MMNTRRTTLVVITIVTAAAASVGGRVLAARAGHAPRTDTSAVVTAQVTPNELLRSLNDLDHSTSTGFLAGACGTVTGIRICLPHLTVDGQGVQDTLMMENLVGLAARSADAKPAPRDVVATRVASQQARQEAQAATVLDELLYREGVASGHAATMDAARNLAMQQLQLVRADPAGATAAGVVPAGTDPAAYFQSTHTIATYQRAMTIALERNAILAGTPASARGATIRQWFSGALARHTVRINGAAPGFSLVQVLDPARV